jgi:Domain of unknown function (DUF6896)
MTEANGAVTRPKPNPLDPIELGVLTACYEASLRRREMISMLADAIGVSADEVFYTWMMRRKWLLDHYGQHRRLGTSGWAYFFHGYECDLRHDDGRLLRYDFGPGGRVDTFTAWGVLQFVMTSMLPWSDYSDLKVWLRGTEAAPARFAGDLGKMGVVWDTLATRGIFQPAAPDLVALQAHYTSVGPDGLTYIRFPRETPETTIIDCAVAHRLVLSPIGVRILDDYTVTQPADPRR